MLQPFPLSNGAPGSQGLFHHHLCSCAQSPVDLSVNSPGRRAGKLAPPPLAGWARPAQNVALARRGEARVVDEQRRRGGHHQHCGPAPVWRRRGLVQSRRPGRAGVVTQRVLSMPLAAWDRAEQIIHYYIKIEDFKNIAQVDTQTHPPALNYFASTQTYFPCSIKLIHLF